MRKALSIVLALTMLFALAIPAMAAAAQPGDTKMSVGGVGFHCDCGLGGEKANTRVTVTNSPYYSDGEIYAVSGQTGRNMNLVFSGNVVDGQEVWTIADGEGTYTCACGNSNWVSFSNEDKIFDGKNVQLYKAGTPTPPAFYGLEVTQNVFVTTTTNNTVENYQRTATPWEEWTQYLSSAYSSVTATNAGNAKVVANSNHFTYAKLDKAALANGVTLDLVVGNKLDKVGKATVKLVGGKLALDFEGDLYKYGFGAVAFDGFIPAVKNGNIHSLGVFSHNNNSTVGIYNLNSFQSTDKKGANYDKDWAGIVPKTAETGVIYLYIHFDNLQYDLGKVKTSSGIDYGEWKFVDSNTTSSSNRAQEVIDVKVFDAEGNEIDETDWNDLPAGTYTVKFYDLRLGDACPYEETVTLVENQILTVSYAAEYAATVNNPPTRNELPDIIGDLVIRNKTVIKK